MICVIDYNSGNIGSILNMLKYIGVDAVASSNHDTIKTSDSLILPGVGAFDSGISRLHEFNLFDIINETVQIDKKPILGICLGAQLMLENSEEGNNKGFGWVSGKVVKFNSFSGIKVPHMGWNNIMGIKDQVLFKNMTDLPPRFYFVHSYHFMLKNPFEEIAITNYGYEFTSAFRKGNVIGVQFHPEKSHRFGMLFLKNFSELR